MTNLWTFFSWNNTVENCFRVSWTTSKRIISEWHRSSYTVVSIGTAIGFDNSKWLVRFDNTNLACTFGRNTYTLG